MISTLDDFRVAFGEFSESSITETHLMQIYVGPPRSGFKLFQLKLSGFLIFFESLVNQGQQIDAQNVLRSKVRRGIEERRGFPRATSSLLSALHRTTLYRPGRYATRDSLQRKPFAHDLHGYDDRKSYGNVM
jgi:hypothetical protein